MDNEVRYLYLDDIIPNRFQPRENFDEQALKELAVSIKEHGVIQPIVVRQIGEKFEIIAGERRYKASTMAGLTKIPAIVRNLDDKESSKVALIENLQRRDLTPIEEARTYQKILELDALTQEELARTMGKSQSAVSNKLRLLSLTDEVQDALLHEQISERHARSLLNVQNPEMQKQLLNKIISTRMTVRELDEEIKNLAGNNENGTNSEQGTQNVKESIPFIQPQPQVNQPLPEQNSVNNNISNDKNLAIPTINDIPNILNNGIKEETNISNEQNVENTNNTEQQVEQKEDNSQLFGGNLFSNMSFGQEPVENETPKKDSDVDVIGGSGLLAGMNSSETIKQPDPVPIQNNNIGLDNNLYQNFDTNIPNPDIQAVNSPINGQMPPTAPTTEEKSIPTIVNEFKEVASNIRNTGKRLELEEFDFDDFYQLVIRIDK